MLGLQSNYSSLPSTKECAGTIHSLQATKIPERYEKLVKILFSQHRCNPDHLLLEPDQSVLHQLGLEMESALLSLDKDSCINVHTCVQLQYE